MKKQKLFELKICNLENLNMKICLSLTWVRLCLSNFNRRKLNCAIITYFFLKKNNSIITISKEWNLYRGSPYKGDQTIPLSYKTINNLNLLINTSETQIFNLRRVPYHWASLAPLFSKLKNIFLVLILGLCHASSWYTINQEI